MPSPEARRLRAAADSAREHLDALERQREAYLDTGFGCPPPSAIDEARQRFEAAESLATAALHRSAEVAR